MAGADDLKLLAFIPTCGQPRRIAHIFERIQAAGMPEGVSLLVVDSSVDDATAAVIEALPEELAQRVRYERAANSMHLDEKVRISFERYCGDYDYIWMLGDGYVPDLAAAYGVVELAAEQGAAVVDIDDRNPFGMPAGKLYSDCAEFFAECFWDVTRYVSTIVSAEVGRVIADEELFAKYAGSGFSYQLQIFEALARLDKPAMYCNVKCFEANPLKKSNGWAQQGLWQWTRSLCSAVDLLPDMYDADCKARALRRLDEMSNFFTFPRLINYRGRGGLTMGQVREYRVDIERVTTVPYGRFVAVARIPKAPCALAARAFSALRGR